MRALMLIAGFGLAALWPTPHARAGGGGPLKITRVHGRVEVEPLTADVSYWSEGKQVGKVGRWTPVRAGYVVGTFLMRTGPRRVPAERAAAHLQWRQMCLDPNSMIRVESYADFGIRVLRGRISAVDGRRGPALFRRYATDEPPRGG